MKNIQKIFSDQPHLWDKLSSSLMTAPDEQAFQKCSTANYLGKREGTVFPMQPLGTIFTSHISVDKLHKDIYRSPWQNSMLFPFINFKSVLFHIRKFLYNVLKSVNKLSIATELFITINKIILYFYQYHCLSNCSSS